MGFSKANVRLLLRFAACRPQGSLLTPALQLVCLMLAWGLAPGFASADQMKATVAITDLGEDPITAQVGGGTNQVNQTFTADKATPEMLMFSVDVDGSVLPKKGESARGIALLLGDGSVSDILQVTVTQKGRGDKESIPYFSASVTFTSDPEPGGLDLSGLGLNDDIMKKVLANGLIEDGTQQNMGSRLINADTGDALSIGGLEITAASDVVPEPSSFLLFGLGLLVLVVLCRRLRIGEVSPYCLTRAPGR